MKQVYLVKCLILSWVVLINSATYAQTTVTLPADCGTCSAVPCTAPIPLSCQANVAIPAGSTATSTVTGGTGGTLTWVISPTTGVSTTSGSGSTTGAITFATAGTYTVTFTSTNSSNPASCSPTASVTCSRTITVNPVATLSAFNCTASTPSPSTFSGNGTAYNGTVTLSYTGGNGGMYAAGSVASTGNTGFTATWPAGTLATGSGTITLTISGSTTSWGRASFPVTIGGQTCIVNLGACGAQIAQGVFKEFLCHNLGADFTLDPHNMAQPNAWALNGAYTQWGRRGPNTTGDSRVDWQTAPNNGSIGFAAAPTATNPNSGVISGWTIAYTPFNSWTETKSSLDPCPTGFRVPSRADWEAVLYNNTFFRTGTFADSPTNYASGTHCGPNSITKQLTLPSAGSRNNADGSLFSRGNRGFYWSSSELTTDQAYFLDLTPSNSTMFARYHNVSMTVRCIAQ